MKQRLSKGKKELLEYLGEPYVIQVIDFENCVYLDMRDYDIEISGGCTKSDPFRIYVWDKYESKKVESHGWVEHNLDQVKELLDNIRYRYTQIV